MKILMILLAAFVLHGCGGTPAVVHDVQTVNMPVREKCIDKLPQHPIVHTDADIKAMDSYHAVFAILSDRIEREKYTNNLEAALTGCQ